MSASALRDSLIVSLAASKAKRTNQAQQFVATAGDPIRLGVGEIISLEGGNQTGKSTIVGTLAGAHQDSRRTAPSDFGVHVEHQMQIDGRRYSPRSVRDASRVGVVAVFQDDKLIPTMTVCEQFVLRHAEAAGLGRFKSAAWKYVRPKICDAAAFATQWLDDKNSIKQWARSLAKTLSPARLPARVIRERAERLFKEFDLDGQEPFSANLDKFPDELSGGARAITKIVSALMVPNLRFLLLDEAFGNVDPEVWIKAIERLRDRALRRELGVLFISHVPAERIRWRPSRRYEIREGVVVSAPTPSGARYVVPSLARRGKDIPLYEVVSSSASMPSYTWATQLRGDPAFVIDRAVRNVEPTNQLVGAIAGLKGGRARILELDIEEHDKTMAQAQDVLSFLAENAPTENCLVVCVGGGTLLNVAGFASSLLLRGRVPTVYVPTTATAIADVAIGSKTGVNQRATGNNRKHVYGSYFDPSALVLDRRYLASQTRLRAIESCAEIVKQGLIQNESLLVDVLAVCASHAPSSNDIYELALRSALLKQMIAFADIEERGIGRALQFGHLHAHSLERASDFSICHNRAVWCGVHIDLMFGPDIALADGRLVKSALRPILRDVLQGVVFPSDDQLQAAYRLETKSEPHRGPDRYSVVVAPSVGAYSDPEHGTLKLEFIDWPQISAGWNDLRSLVI